MARFKVNQLSEYPYHITARRNNREHFPLPLDTVWKIFEEDLYMSNIKFGLKIHSFVLMPNHFHLMARVTDTPIGKIMSEMMTSVSKEINRRSGNINHTFGGRHFKCELTNYHHSTNCYKYIYQNPVRANLTSLAQDWKYSTLNGILGLQKMFIPLEEDTVLFNPNFDESELIWINTQIEPSHLEDFRLGLKKKTFKLPKHRNKFPCHPLELYRI